MAHTDYRMANRWHVTFLPPQGWLEHVRRKLLWMQHPDSDMYAFAIFGYGILLWKCIERR